MVTTIKKDNKVFEFSLKSVAGLFGINKRDQFGIISKEERLRIIRDIKNKYPEFVNTIQFKEWTKLFMFMDLDEESKTMCLKELSKEIGVNYV